MGKKEEKNSIRVVSGALCAFLLLLTFIACFYIASEADHDCDGENCPICACIENCVAVLQRVGTAVPVFTSYVLCAFVAVILSNQDNSYIFRLTPVSRKVRLND